MGYVNEISPVCSRGSSIPVFAPKPYFLRQVRKSSLLINRDSILVIPTFEEYSYPLSKVMFPQPFRFQSYTVFSPTAIDPDLNEA